MSSGKGKSDRGVVELSVEPVVAVVALLAHRGKTAGGVIGIDGRFVVGCVAGIAGSGHRLKLAAGRSFVT